MLFEAYKSLASRFPETCPHLFGVRINDSQGLWLSLDAQKHPNLLFEIEDDDGLPDLKLKSVETRFACHCKIQLQNGSELSGIYTIVSLTNDDPDIIRVFLRLLEEAFLVPGTVHSAAAVREQIVSIADIFAVRNNDVKDVLGLWGELHIIRSAVNLNAAVQAWSSSPHARYDFMTESFALEIKATLKSSRQHRFTLEQLRTESDISIFVASILLIELPNGETASELIEQVIEALSDPEERNRFFRHCVRKGGVDIYRSELRLATLPDDASISVFEAKSLPVPSICAHDPISNVRFDLNLSELQNLSNTVRNQTLNFEQFIP